jgi:predicted lipid-binding transport protein (Tim44 family)
MGNSFQFIDIIFFAMIAIFLILRLRGVLGKRDENGGSGFQKLFKQDHNTVKSDRDIKESNVVELTDTNPASADNLLNKVIEDQDDPEAHSAANKTDNPLLDGILLVQEHDTNFDEEDFIVGARVAFEMILKSYASAEVDELKPLLSNDVFGNFSKAIHDREQAGHLMEDTLVSIVKSEMVEAYMEDKTANITIKFESEQVNAVRDENGDVVEGNANLVITTTDFWTFARETDSLDPNWLLVATRSLE